MPKFYEGAFALAGLIAASGPVIIHLLNRRRYRVVSWAAMDFLRQAMQRNRKAVQLRDLIILLLRCLAVALFGAGLARPFLQGASSATLLIGLVTLMAVVAAVVSAGSGILAEEPHKRRGAFLITGVTGLVAALSLLSMFAGAGDAAGGLLAGRQPVHAVLILDNSMSMGVESLEGSLLDRAKVKAAEFIDALPSGSQIHLIPLCSSGENETSSVWRNKAEARAALERITLTDRTARASYGLEQAAEACRQVPELPSKRIALLSDQQVSLWSAGVSESLLQALPDLQIMKLAPQDPVENVRIVDFQLPDGVADTETPATFTATIENSGSASVAGAQVVLAIDEVDVATQSIDLEPGQLREIEFRQRFDAVTDTGALGSGAASSTSLTATLTVKADAGAGDDLPRDNSRHLVVPVVAGLPVVFIDQFGEDENLDRGDAGETLRLRRLLAPRTSTDEEENRQLVRIRHVTVDQVNEELLADARLVVMAGVEAPGEAVSLLRQYVEQGGPLVIAAGADFNPEAWQTEAWLDGAGILPAPLESSLVGQLPETATGPLVPFFLDFNSLQHSFFLIEGESRESLEDLYRLPIFFRAAGFDLSEASLSALIKAETDRLTRVRTELNQLTAANGADSDSGSASGSAAPAVVDEDRLRELKPEWLRWAGEEVRAALDELPVATLAERSRPLVLARYTQEGRPFLLERRIGAGRLLFVTSGLYSSWNTLTGTNAIVVFDRMLRSLLRETLPDRTFDTGATVSLPAQRAAHLRWTVTPPDGQTEALSIEALSASRSGLRVRRTSLQGLYQVQAIESDGTTEQQRSVTPLAFNCPSEESDLETLDEDAFRQKIAQPSIRWLEGDEALSIEGARLRGRDLWKWMIAATLLFLLTEMGMLAWPHVKQTEDSGRVKP